MPEGIMMHVYPKIAAAVRSGDGYLNFLSQLAVSKLPPSFQLTYSNGRPLVLTPFGGQRQWRRQLMKPSVKIGRLGQALVYY